MENFKKNTGNILRDLRNAKKMPGEDRIYTAGEKEYIAWQERKDKGIPIDNELQKQIKELKDEFSLSKYNFPF